MRSGLVRYSCIALLLVSALGLDIKTDEQNAQIVQMTAKKYEFSPAQIHARLGKKIQLKIIAIDRDHGFTIVRDPVGDDSSTAHPGLVFSLPAGRNGWRLEKGKETMIEFVARAPGIYTFNCSLACGLHHGRMKGQLIVDPGEPSSRTGGQQDLR